MVLVFLPEFHTTGVFALPRLSAAMTMPSLNFTARTEVPVTMGDLVCVFGPRV